MSTTVPSPAPPLAGRHVTTLVYAFDGAGRLCLLHRRAAPNAGLWSPPGGKIDPDETPLANALRELAEETGLVGHAPRLVAVATEHDAARGEAWLMFLVRVAVGDAALTGGGREGEPAWFAPADVAALPTPPADGHLLVVVREAATRPGVAFIDLAYDDGALTDVRTTWA